MKVLMMAAVMAVSSWASAQSMDKAAIDGAVIVRVDTRTREMSVATTREKLKNEEQAKAVSKSAKFAPVPKEHQMDELDREAGSSSWYCYYPAYYNPYLYWYGAAYTPYYYYGYGYYSYYYYNSYGWWW